MRGDGCTARIAGDAFGDLVHLQRMGRERRIAEIEREAKRARKGLELDERRAIRIDELQRVVRGDGVERADVLQWCALFDGRHRILHELRRHVQMRSEKAGLRRVARFQPRNRRHERIEGLYEMRRLLLVKSHSERVLSHGH